MSIQFEKKFTFDFRMFQTQPTRHENLVGQFKLNNSYLLKINSKVHLEYPHWYRLFEHHHNLQEHP